MDFTLSQFKSNLVGLVRPNRFTITFDAASVTAIGLTGEYEYLIKTASIPDIQNNKIPIQWFGMELKIPGDPKYNTFDVTFRVTNDWKIVQSLEKWSELAANSITNTRGSSYKGKIVIKQYSENNAFTGTPRGFSTTAETLGTGELALYELQGVFPTNVSGIELTQDSQDTIIEVRATFSVDQWF